jgi:hypothetical protein
LCKPKLPYKADKKNLLSLDNSDEILDLFPKAPPLQAPSNGAQLPIGNVLMIDEDNGGGDPSS